MQARPVLHKLVKDTCPRMHRARRTALEVHVMAALTGSRLTVTDPGRSMTSPAKPKHCIKRADRLLSNAHLHEEREAIYAELTRLLVGSRTRPVIIVDWSDMEACKRHFLLRASLAVAGRCLTLHEEAHTAKTKEKPRSHLNFQRQLKGVLSADCQLVPCKAKPKGRVHHNRSGRKARNSPSRKHAARAKEPWLSATSLPSSSSLARNVVQCYRWRMQIEESFRDLKSTRFGLSLELHLGYQVERLQILLLIAALALMVAWLMGKATELTGQHWQYQANTVRTRKALSTIFIGLKMTDDRRTPLTADHLIAAWETLHDTIPSHCLFDEADETRKAA